MRRQRLISYKGLLLTQDMAHVLEAMERKASDNGRWRVKYLQPPDVTAGDPLSLAIAGREVRFVFDKHGATQQEALNAAWACAIPLGILPWLRYPLLKPGSQVFHYFGDWKVIYDRLLAEGRGHLAWPSVCCAAQVDIGVWAGDKEEARFVQAQLHRLGRNAGPLDGVIGQRSAAAIESLNLTRPSLTLVAEHLRTADLDKKPEVSLSRGHMLIPGRDLVVSAYGGVKSWQAPNGAGFEVNGPGRIVVDVR